MNKNKTMPFCPQINGKCKGNECICFGVKGLWSREVKQKGKKTKRTKDWFCKLYNKSFLDWGKVS